MNKIYAIDELVFIRVDFCRFFQKLISYLEKNKKKDRQTDSQIESKKMMMKKIR